jgi:hypothetical protein
MTRGLAFESAGISFKGCRQLRLRRRWAFHAHGILRALHSVGDHIFSDLSRMNADNAVIGTRPGACAQKQSLVTAQLNRLAAEAIEIRGYLDVLSLGI